MLRDLEMSESKRKQEKGDGKNNADRYKTPCFNIVAMFVQCVSPLSVKIYDIDQYSGSLFPIEHRCLHIQNMEAPIINVTSEVIPTWSTRYLSHPLGDDVR